MTEEVGKGGEQGNEFGDASVAVSGVTPSQRTSLPQATLLSLPPISGPPVPRFDWMQLKEDIIVPRHTQCNRDITKMTE
eukprot:gene9418-biopygen976